MEQHTPTFAGIDVSKAHLDVYLHPDGSHRRFNNDKTGWRAIRGWIIDVRLQGVFYEATGSYHKGVELYLGKHGLPIARLDPRRAQKFAQALGIITKTDPIDARGLAHFGAFLKPPTISLPTPAFEQLKELVSARRGLMQQRTRIINKSKTVSVPLLKRQLRLSKEQIARQIVQVDEACQKIVKSDPVLTQRLTILKSIPAIGDVTALTLLAEMPELGDLNDKQATSLLGVAPMTRDSGTWKGKRFIRGGRATVRRAVYMAALSAMRFNADMKVKYHTLVKAGKPPKLALTVIMRKLIILANALIRDNRQWSEVRP